ncbi:MAG TPA: AMP-binding protein [Methylomirabilota bacterium]|nr:AMP-binding protein [Methylomirabilota bacterium]
MRKFYSMAGYAPGNRYRDATLASMLDDVLRRHPAREALVFLERRLSYADLGREIERCARGLLALGIEPNDRVALWMPNRPEWLVMQHAVARIGAVLVAVNTRHRAHELDYVLRQSGATALVLQDHAGPVDYLERLDEVLPRLHTRDADRLSFERFPRLRHVVCLADDAYGGTHRHADILAAGEDPGLEALLASRRTLVTPDRVFAILYTSGTTAFPKGAMISHENAVPHAFASGARLGLSEQDRVLHTLPFSGTWGGLLIPLMAWSHGAALVVTDGFDPAVVIHLIEQERITVWNAVDAMLAAVLDHPELERHDRSSLRTGGVAMTGGGRHGLFDEVVGRLGMTGAVQPYGMTEVNALALCPCPDDPVELRRRAGGWPAEGLEARVVDPDTGADRPSGEAGELLLRGPQVTRGYHEKPEETRKAIDPDGWLHTGDLAVLDAAGRVFFVGRLKETLRIGHQMVAPAEIEAFLVTHPKLAQAFVVGVPDARLGEVAVAYVIPRPAAAPTESEVIAHCRGRLAGYKVPRHVFVVPDVPRTPGPHGDKVQRARLREDTLRLLGCRD